MSAIHAASVITSPLVLVAGAFGGNTGYSTVGTPFGTLQPKVINGATVDGIFSVSGSSNLRVLIDGTSRGQSFFTGLRISVGPTLSGRFLTASADTYLNSDGSGNTLWEWNISDAFVNGNIYHVTVEP